MKFKIMLCLFLMISFIFTSTNLTIISDSKSQQYYDFSSFTEYEALNFVKEQMIVMPDGFEDIEGHEEEVLKIIQFAYEHPEDCMGYSSTLMYNFSLEISEKVHSYMEQ